METERSLTLKPSGLHSSKMVPLKGEGEGGREEKGWLQLLGGVWTGELGQVRPCW